MTALSKLLLAADHNSEIVHNIHAKKFRIDLKPEDLRLWSETLDGLTKPCNLLLACEHSDRALNDTCLTWVVGSAIRSFNIQSAQDVAPLLTSLGIDAQLSDSLPNLCLGLGSELVWAFYLDRNGDLSASPVPETN